VLDALASRFADLSRRRLLRVPDARRAAEQFAYLVVGAPLDRALLTGTIPSKEQITACASDGVETFLARYGAGDATPASAREQSRRRSRAEPKP
jgi:TetR/AcrR family transcriptional repressor of mexJK operon